MFYFEFVQGQCHLKFFAVTQLTMLCRVCKQTVNVACTGVVPTDLNVCTAVASNGLTARVSCGLNSIQQKEKAINNKLNKLVYY